MPSPYPKYRPAFTAEDLDTAQSVVRQQNASHAQVVRAKMVLLLAERPSIGNDQLSQKAGVHYNTACKWRRRWAEEGFILSDHPRSGRPGDFSPCTNRAGQSGGLSTA